MKEPHELTEKQRKELAALSRLPDNKIDTRSIPEVRDWSGAKRGIFYRGTREGANKAC